MIVLYIILGVIGTLFICFLLGLIRLSVMNDRPLKGLLKIAKNRELFYKNFSTCVIFPDKNKLKACADCAGFVLAIDKNKNFLAIGILGEEELNVKSVSILDLISIDINKSNGESVDYYDYSLNKECLMVAIKTRHENINFPLMNKYSLNTSSNYPKYILYNGLKTIMEDLKKLV